jgi:hypothetical protein
MGAARTAMLGSIDDVDAAIASLLAETDPQDDDVIKIDPYNFRPSDVDSIRAHLGDARALLNAGYTRTEDWDGDPFTPPVALTINLGNWLSSPIADWKSLFPAYTASAVAVSRGIDYRYDNGIQAQSVNIPTTGYYSMYYSYQLTGGPPYESYYGDAALLGAARAVVQQRLAQVQAMPRWTGYFYGASNFEYSYLSAGTQTLSFSWYDQYPLTASSVFAPKITWDALTFDQWIWPDATLHGLLPGMTSSAQLLGTFGITVAQWQREVVLDWGGGGVVSPGHPAPWGGKRSPAVGPVSSR